MEKVEFTPKKGTKVFFVLSTIVFSLMMLSFLISVGIFGQINDLLENGEGVGAVLIFLFLAIIFGASFFMYYITVPLSILFNILNLIKSRNMVFKNFSIVYLTLTGITILYFIIEKIM